VEAEFIIVRGGQRGLRDGVSLATAGRRFWSSEHGGSLMPGPFIPDACGAVLPMNMKNL